jgi:chaperonin GroEL (HSP60 family)
VAGGHILHVKESRHAAKACGELCTMRSSWHAGKASLAMEAFGRALRKIPTIICDNAGMGAVDVITQLRAAGAQEERSKDGVDVMSGGPWSGAGAQSA